MTTTAIGRTDVDQLEVEVSGNGDASDHAPLVIGDAGGEAADAGRTDAADASPRRQGRRFDRDELAVLVRERWRELAGWAGLALGGVAGFLTWIGVSGKDIAPLQLPYLASGGIAAVILTIAGVGLLVGSDLQRDRQRLRRIEGELVELQDLVRSLLDDGGSATSAPTPPRRSRAAASRR